MSKTDASASANRSNARGFGYMLGAIFLAYVGFAVAFYLWKGEFFTPDPPDSWALLLLVGAVALGRWKSFLVDWIPFVALIFGYEMLRGFAGTVISPDLIPSHPGAVHFHFLLNFDSWLFGGTPLTKILQDRLYDPNVVHWYDALAAIVYSLHFALPLVFGFILWTRSRAQFRWFVATLLIMTYSTFVIFLLLPTAPPWLLLHWGYFPGIHDPFNQAAAGASDGSSSHFGAFTIWTEASPNPVAAFPSLHAAYPWLVMLFSVRIFGKKGFVMLIYNAALWFSIVYLAQHWVIDAFAGIAWATVSFFLVEFLLRRLPSHIIGDYRPVRSVKPTMVTSPPT